MFVLAILNKEENEICSMDVTRPNYKNIIHLCNNLTICRKCSYENVEYGVCKLRNIPIMNNSSCSLKLNINIFLYFSITVQCNFFLNKLNFK